MDEVSQTTTGVVEAQPVVLRLDAETLTIHYEMERRDRAIPLTHLTGLDDQVGLLTGGVTLALGAETVAITRIPRAEARALAAALRTHLRDRPPSPEPPPQLEPGPVADDLLDTSPLAELERLGRLHAAGVLTDEEFTDAKRRLLDRL